MPFLQVAVEDGDEVLVVGPRALREMVEHSGFSFWECDEPSEDEIAPIREQLATAPSEVASVLGNRDLFGRLATTAMLPSATRAFLDWKPNFVLREPCEYSSALLARRFAISAATVAISQAAAEDGSIRVASPALEDHDTGLTDFVRALPYLTRFPESIDPSPFDATVRFGEPIRRSTRPLPDWWSGSTAPLVYVTFGTVFGHMSFSVDVWRVALEAIGELDARVLVTTGKKFDRSNLGTVPANAHVEAWVDQHEVLASADLVVCHGGSGTALGALGAGIPMVIHPMFADQHANATTIEAAGACEVVKPRDAVALASSIRRVLADGAYRAQAERIAEEMRGMPDIREAIAEVRSDVKLPRRE